MKLAAAIKIASIFFVNIYFLLLIRSMKLMIVSLFYIFEYIYEIAFTCYKNIVE